MNDVLSMNIKELKFRADQIRKEYSGRRAVPWPLEFKADVVRFVESGHSIKEVAGALGLSYPLVSTWSKKFVPESVPTTEKVSSSSSYFQEASIMEDTDIQGISVFCKSGVQVSGLSIEDLKLLLKEGLI